MALGAAELSTVVGEDGADRQVEVAVERQHVVVQHGDCRLGLLRDVQEAEGIRSVGVDHGVQVDLADALEGADEEGVSREQLARRVALLSARILRADYNALLTLC
jgi:hypothetical protein